MFDFEDKEKILYIKIDFVYVIIVMSCMVSKVEINVFWVVLYVNFLIISCIFLRYIFIKFFKLFIISEI